MRTMSYTESRARYAEVLDSVANDREEVVITRAGHEPVVIARLGRERLGRLPLVASAGPQGAQANQRAPD